MKAFIGKIKAAFPCVSARSLLMPAAKASERFASLLLGKTSADNPPPAEMMFLEIPSLFGAAAKSKVYRTINLSLWAALFGGEKYSVVSAAFAVLNKSTLCGRSCLRALSISTDIRYENHFIQKRINGLVNKIFFGVSEAGSASYSLSACMNRFKIAQNPELKRAETFLRNYIWQPRRNNFPGYVGDGSEARFDTGAAGGAAKAEKKKTVNIIKRFYSAFNFVFFSRFISEIFSRLFINAFRTLNSSSFLFSYKNVFLDGGNNSESLRTGAAVRRKINYFSGAAAVAFKIIRNAERILRVISANKSSGKGIAAVFCRGHDTFVKPRPEIPEVRFVPNANRVTASADKITLPQDFRSAALLCRQSGFDHQVKNELIVRRCFVLISRLNNIFKPGFSLKISEDRTVNSVYYRSILLSKGAWIAEKNKSLFSFFGSSNSVVRPRAGAVSVRAAFLDVKLFCTNRALYKRNQRFNHFDFRKKTNDNIFDHLRRVILKSSVFLIIKNAFRNLNSTRRYIIQSKKNKTEYSGNPRLSARKETGTFFSPLKNIFFGKIKTTRFLSQNIRVRYSARTVRDGSAANRLAEINTVRGKETFKPLRVSCILLPRPALNFFAYSNAVLFRKTALRNTKYSGGSSNRFAAFEHHEIIQGLNGEAIIMPSGIFLTRKPAYSKTHSEKSAYKNCEEKNILSSHISEVSAPFHTIAARIARNMSVIEPGAKPLINECRKSVYNSSVSTKRISELFSENRIYVLFKKRNNTFYSQYITQKNVLQSRLFPNVQDLEAPLLRISADVKTRNFRNIHHGFSEVYHNKTKKFFNKKTGVFAVAARNTGYYPRNAFSAETICRLSDIILFSQTLENFTVNSRGNNSVNNYGQYGGDIDLRFRSGLYGKDTRIQRDAENTDFSDGAAEEKYGNLINYGRSFFPAAKSPKAETAADEKADLSARNKAHIDRLEKKQLELEKASLKNSDLNRLFDEMLRRLRRQLRIERSGIN